MSDICTLLFEHVQHVRTFLIYVVMVKDLYKLESLQNWSCIHLWPKNRLNFRIQKKHVRFLLLWHAIGYLMFNVLKKKLGRNAFMKKWITFDDKYSLIIKLLEQIYSSWSSFQIRFPFARRSYHNDKSTINGSTSTYWISIEFHKAELSVVLFHLITFFIIYLKQ